MTPQALTFRTTELPPSSRQPKRLIFSPYILRQSRRWRQNVPPKRWHLYTTVYGFTFQNMEIISADVRTWNIVQEVHFQNKATVVIHSLRPCHECCTNYSCTFVTFQCLPGNFRTPQTQETSICSGPFTKIYKQHARPPMEQQTPRTTGSYRKCKQGRSRQ